MSMNLENYIIQTFQKYNIIGLGEGGHGLENSHEFIRNMFDNPKIQEIIDVVIVEFANVHYQDILDNYIFGKEVDMHDLRQSWRQSGQPGRQGEIPIYFELLKKIRNINIKLPQNKKIRVLGGDPPIDWKTINTLEHWKEQIGYKREIFPAELAIQFGVKQNKKVLVIYSESHLTKITDHQVDTNYPSITSIVNKTYTDNMKVIGTVYSKTFLSDSRFKSLPLNSIINLTHDPLGDAPATTFFNASLYNKEGKELVLFEKYKIKEIFDALLYVGQFDTLKRCPMPEPDFDNKYWDELNRRRKIVGMKSIPNLKN